MQTSIPCTMMRGGTSRGPFFLANDLPRDEAVRDQVLLAAMGSANAQQIDGIGGGTTLTSKAAIISISQDPNADIDYLFAQVSVDKMSVDTSPSCGNIMAGVAPFAIEAGLVNAENGETLVKIRNVNTDSLIEVLVQTPNGQVQYEGKARIDGVEGEAAPVLLNFLDVAGTKTGKLLPTGNLRDTFDGVEVSCIDAAVPAVLIPAQSLGKTGWESKEELDGDSDLLKRIESIRKAAGEKMGLGDVSDKVIPKVSLISKPQFGGSITSRYFVPFNCHASHAVTGAVCVGVCAALEGSVADGLVDSEHSDGKNITIEHPSGKIDLVLEVEFNSSSINIKSAGLLRTARKLFRGELYVPSAVWNRDS